ncbi:MAG: Omp28-related outer membrane protein [Bacteroidia bacterium]|nr:Omp28-related outer membrane protein [Bacteroidia bacterium]MDW8159735.1 Omp28-related outer membrane protein [Bacteroidia bacterium]
MPVAKDQDIVVTIINVSSAEIRNCEISWSLNDGPPQVQTWNFQAGFLQNYQATVTHPRKLNLPSTGVYRLRIWISKLNGAADANSANSDITLQIKGMESEERKKVVFEKFTGTWCPHCPAANCDLIKILSTYPNFFAIDVHDRDAMENTAINPTMKSRYQVSSFPSAMIDRRILPGQTKAPVSPYMIYQNARNFTQQNSPFALTMTHTYNKSTRDIEIKITARAIAQISGNFAFNCAIIEDSIPGVGSGYEQRIDSRYTTDRNNCYYGQTSPMRNYFHMHVLRDYLGGGNGTSISKTSFKPNESIQHTYRYKLPTQFNEKQVKIIAFIEGTDSEVNYTGIFNAERQALILSPPTNIESNITLGNIQIYPNPTRDLVYVQFQSNSSITKEPLNITVTNLLGQTVEKQIWQDNMLSQEISIPLSLKHLNEGVYFITIQQGTKKYTQKILYQP